MNQTYFEWYEIDVNAVRIFIATFIMSGGMVPYQCSNIQYFSTFPFQKHLRRFQYYFHVRCNADLETYGRIQKVKSNEKALHTL